MLVEEDQVYIEVCVDNYDAVKEQIDALVIEAGEIRGTSSVTPRNVSIGSRTLFDFLYLLESEINLYGGFASIRIKYLRVRR